MYLFRKFPLKLNKSNLEVVLNALKMPFYAVAKGRTSGIFMTWADCEAQVKGFSGARYKKFDTVEGAQNFITSISGVSSISNTKKQNTVSRKPNASYSSLKRTYSTSNANKNNSRTADKEEPETSYNDSNSFEDTFSDDNEDLDSVLHKQLDDIEKRLAQSEKRIDKINGKPNTSRKTKLIDAPEQKKKKYSENSANTELEEDENGYIQVYTDGACSANGKFGAKAGFGVFWGDGHPLNVSKPVSGRATNNCGEIQAATCAIKTALKNGIKKLAINTDSQFVINSVTKWMPGWKRKGWKLKSGDPVKNEKDFKELDALQHKLDVKWNYVEAHRGIHGNEMADQLAKAGAALYKYK